MSTLGDTIRNIATEVESLEAQIAAHEATIAMMVGEYRQLEDEVMALEAQIAALQAERTALLLAIQANTEQMQQVSEQLDQMQLLLDQQGELIAALEYQLAEANRVTVTITASEDGSDQTAAIQAQIDAAPDGTHIDFPTIIQFPAGRYHTEGDLANNPRGELGVIRITNRHNLAIEGPCTLYTEAPAVPYHSNVDSNTHSLRRHFWLKNSSNITVRNIRIEGSNYTEGPSLVAGTPAFWLGGPDTGSQPGYPGYRPGWELEHAFAIDGCYNVTLENCEADSIWGDGIYLGNFPTNPSDDVTLINCYLHWTGRQGVAMSNCLNVLVDNVEVDKGRRAAIDLEPFSDNSAVTDVEIKDCTLRCLGTHFAALGRGDVSRINIHDNTLYGTGGTINCEDSAGVTRRSGWIFANNTRVSNFGSTVAPLRFAMTDNITIDGNTIPVVATQSRKCVTFDDCQGALVVTNNDFKDGCTVGPGINSAPIINEGNTFGATCP